MKKTTGLTFGLAIEAAKEGFRIAKNGWNGKGMFVFWVPPSIVPRELLRGACLAAVEVSANTAPVQNIRGHFDMLAADGDIIVGWAATQSDLQDADWYIVL